MRLGTKRFGIGPVSWGWCLLLLVFIGWIGASLPAARAAQDEN
jgi:hypothetical protein